MPVVETLAAAVMAGAPPAAVPDAQISVAIYCEASCSVDAVLQLQDELDDWFAFKGPLGELGPATTPRASLAPLPVSEYGLPDAELLQAYGIGLSDADAAGIGASQEIVVVEVAAPRAQALEAQRRLNRAALGFAASQNGWLEDLDTREIFSRDAWTSERVGALGDDPELWRLLRVESYDVDGWDRVVTLGMRKFGLHELVVAQSLPDFSEDLAAAMILMAAQGIEGQSFTESYTLNLGAVQGAATGAWLREHLWVEADPGVMTPGQGQITVRLTTTQPQEGDNATPTLEIGLSTPGDTPAEQVGAFLDTLWGYGDLSAPEAAPEAAAPPADPGAPGAAPPSLDEARAQALATVQGPLKARWSGGLPEGSALYVKGPFPTPDGQVEWMWVEVRGWDSDELRGVLMNDPYAVPGLMKGSVVSVPEGEVFDYLLRTPSGQEGGATEAFL